MTPEEIRQKLVEDGWSISSHCTKDGGWKQPSEYSVSIARGDGWFVTKYTMGSAYRVWKGWGRFRNKYVKIGQRIPQIFGPVNVCDAGELESNTRPEDPKLEDVMHSLTLDASGVRHGQTFEEFCADFGYSDDSIEAKRVFDACTNIWRDMVRLGANFDELDEMYIDY